MTKTLFALLLLVFQAFPLASQEPLHVALLGDSNTWLGGDDCNKPQGWNKWFCDMLQPTSCKSYARSGATWTNTSQTHRNTKENIGILGNDNVIYNQICRLKEAIDSCLQPMPQLILILAGTNDAWFLESRPDALSISATEAFSSKKDSFINRDACQVLTLAESVRYGCELLKTACPEAQIILLTPLQSVAAGKENINRVAEIIDDCGQLMGISVLRLDRDAGISAEREKNRHHMTTDGTHTSVLGARIVGEFVARHVKPLMTHLNNP